MAETFLAIPADICDHVYVDESSPSLLRWKANRGNHVKKDQIAGTQRPDGRWRLVIGRKGYYTYRIYMHLTQQIDLQNLIVDHANGNSACNSAHNLRVATRAQNNANRKPQGKYKGVSYHAQSGLWRARIHVNGKETTSYHATDEQAACAYDKLAVKAHGQFARLNFPEKADVFIGR